MKEATVAESELKNLGNCYESIISAIITLHKLENYPTTTEPAKCTKIQAI